MQVLFLKAMDAFVFVHLYRAINNYLDQGRLWLWQCQIFRIFAKLS
jgi:hypothetical protein